MALQWFDPVKPTPKPSRPPPLMSPPAFSKHDLVFVLGIFGGDDDGNADTSFNLCEVVNYGYRLQQREYVYFCRVIDNLFPVETVVLCKARHLRKPKYRAGTVLQVRDLDDRVNGVGVIGDWRVRIECLELVHGKCVYWIKIPDAGKRHGNLILDVEEAKLEKMVAAASASKKRRKAK